MSIKKLAANQKVTKEGLIRFSDDGVAPPRLLASQCPKCGKVFFPQKGFCPTCMIESVEQIELSNEGSLYTHTVVHIGVKGFATPYVLGWVDLPEKIRLATQIEWDPARAAELRSGQKLELFVGKLRALEDGTEIVGYKYKPVI